MILSPTYLQPGPTDEECHPHDLLGQHRGMRLMCWPAMQAL
ncbi:hypothetical protein CPter91_2193 [Collimonas pratensis]|uniref:Uncharacterized protein n=1 Tax=Collimonas pratensis TaxID=279113 RepID=A0A127Q3D0_9BURK|nr:hypothetical protein CPter91_2193 [Collimonas pratensis]